MNAPKPIRFASVCDGISAVGVAWKPLGWQFVFKSEIEPFPSAVADHHHPEAPNLGDMTQHKTWNDYGIDLICGGTPCQAFSVAGLRKGLDDPRGNLTLTYLAVIAQYRPRWVVWENVPGVLSDKTGAFGSFLGGLGQLGYGFAYRILDAQYYRVAQRRRRVLVVGHIGGLWQRAAAVLFERDSLSGNPAPRRESGKRTATTLDVRAGRSGETSFHSSGGLIECADIAPSLGASGRGFERAGETRGQDPVIALSSTLSAKPPGSQENSSTTVALQNMAVRRLTPRECERLQGFPDDYTLINYRNKPAADGPRYKALGNSMAVPKMRWLGERIQLLEQLCPYE